MRQQPILTTSGYDKLRPRRIHFFCPQCGLKRSNLPRFEGYDNLPEAADPKTAVYAVTPCQRCGNGCKEVGDPTYYTKALKLVRSKFQRGHEARKTP